MQAVSVGFEKDNFVGLKDGSEISILQKNIYSLRIERKITETDDVFEDYYEESQQICDGTEEHPEFTNHHILVKGKERSLKTDLKTCGFPPNIIAEADEVHSQMNTGLKRGARKRREMFFCVLTAYNNLGITVDPTQIAKMCKISPSEISKAISMCSPSKTNFKAPSVNKTPKDFLEGFVQKITELDIVSFSDDALNEIEIICEDVVKNSQELRDEKPQTVAAAIIVFYLQLHNCVIDRKKYNEIFSKSEMTILKIKNKVAIAYNS
jgi:hypothetical protein